MDTEIIMTALLAAAVVLLIIVLILIARRPSRRAMQELRTELIRRLSETGDDITGTVRTLNDSHMNAVSLLGQTLSEGQRAASEAQSTHFSVFEGKMSMALTGQQQVVEGLKNSVTEQVTQLRNEVHTQIDTMDKELTEDQKQLNESVSGKITQLQSSMSEQMNQFRETTSSQLRLMDNKLGEDQTKLKEAVTSRTETLNAGVNNQLTQMLTQLQHFSTATEEKLEAVRGSVADGMKLMREENGKKLDEIRGTVDEKLQTTLEKRISESFKTVNEQLEQVYKGLGEMQAIASDVGGLKKVLSGVKTRGILGEVQLGAILEEILSPEQYEKDIATVPGSSERVEFAIRLPAQDGTVYLPIDSKFPGDRYAQLLDAQESGEKDRTDAAYKELENVIKAEAKDIRTKYVEVPYTTNFGIMFLPFEGLYAEVVSHGLIEELQRRYQVNVAGPSTMAALLNSLQMGFRTLAIQKRSSEVWEVLGAVKTEFDKFEDVMKKMETHLNQTSDDLEKLMGTRTKKIQSKLRMVQKLDDSASADLLELTAPDYVEIDD